MSKVKILVVDDEPHIRLFMSKLMQRLPGVEVVTASNGLEAIEMYPHEKPDLVLMDVNMPKLPGNEALAELSQLDPQARVMMLTSQSTRHVVLETAHAGALAFIRKDQPKEVILESVRCLLNDAGHNFEPPKEESL